MYWWLQHWQLMLQRILFSYVRWCLSITRFWLKLKRLRQHMLQNNRESNFELLRIISMIMVLAIHANFFSTGELSIEDTQNYFIQSILRCFSHSLCVGAVNTFVLISGYFGIRYKNRGLANLLFQCLFKICILQSRKLILGW